MNANTTVLTRADAARHLGVSERTLDRMTRNGIGPRRIDISMRRVGYLQTDLEQWLKARTEAGEAETAD